MIDLLSPVGDFNCLKAAVQNGANSVYFGAQLFSARAYASNFNMEELEEAITYAKLRGIKTNLTLNTLIKDSEFEDAFALAKKAYEFGIDAIIVQDLGLAKQLIKHFPDLDIHASTQMSIHNLQGVLQMQKLGFKRVVLSRELSMREIQYICRNSKIETEVFIHGALCISFSGQCLFSSLVGGRSGNRGKCAQACRLPYKLLENNHDIDSGYLISPRDLCGLDYIPDLLKTGVTSLKIEGRMKNPEYVATVTRIYRKYIDLAESGVNYKVDNSDKKALLQAFNRGSFSNGHLDDSPNKNFIFKEKSNNMGLFLGKVQKYNKNKGYITVKLCEPIKIGDTVSLEHETGTYNVSELMLDNKNITDTKINQTVTIGRMKGNINLGDKIYKISSKEMNIIANESIKSEHIKIPLSANISIKKGEPIKLNIKSANNLNIYKNLNINCESSIIPEEAHNKPLDEEKILKQLHKTTDTLFEFNDINIDLDKNIFLPKISTLNELRRTALDEVQKYAINNIQRKINKINYDNLTINKKQKLKKEISVLLNNLNIDFEYSNLSDFNNVYIPLKYFSNEKYSKILSTLQEKFNMYIYMPTIIKANYRNMFFNIIEKTINKYKIKGFVISNLSNFILLENLLKNTEKKFKLISNYTLNVFNHYSISELKKLGINRFTLSPESDKEIMYSLCDNPIIENELIVYGKTPLMNMKYCVLGNTNKCYPTCSMKCQKTDNMYFLKDRLNMNFRVMFDNIQCVSTIYNSKITSICKDDFNINCARIDILDESIDDINMIIKKVKNNERFEGKDYTNGNLNREI